MPRITPMLLATISLTLFASCGKKKEEVKPSELEGTWEQVCYKPSDDTRQVYRKESISFAGDTLTRTVGVFADESCTVKGFGNRSLSTFTLGAEVAAPAGAKAIDTLVTGFFVTLFTDKDVADLNGTGDAPQALCGGGFVKGIEKSITKEQCQGSREESIFAPRYEIFKVDGTNLFAGKTSEVTNGTTAEKRMVELETRVYIKK